MILHTSAAFEAGEPDVKSIESRLYFEALARAMLFGALQFQEELVERFIIPGLRLLYSASRTEMLDFEYQSLEQSNSA